MQKIKIIFLSDWGVGGNPYKRLLIEHISHKKVQAEEYSFINVIFLPQVIRQQIPDILHLHTLHRFLLGRNRIFRLLKLFIFISQIFVLRLLGTKVVWTVHEWYDKLGDGRRNIPKNHGLIIGKFLHAVIAHSESTRHEVTETFGLKNEDKAFVIPHANYIGYYENKVERLDARKALGIQADNLVFLLFGNIYPYKGVLEAIDAFKRLPQDKISLLIAGNPNEEQLKELITNKICDFQNISFIPRRVPDNEVQTYMNACDCVVIPYKVFTTSGVALLAMSFGRACLAPDVGFFRDVLDDSGAILYDSRHEEGLLHAMECAIEKKNNIFNMGKHNLKLAEQWSWDYVAEETLKVYKKCLGC